MSSKLNTHYYDGKLNISNLKPLDPLSSGEKLSIANDLLSHLADKVAINFMKRIIIIYTFPTVANLILIFSIFNGVNFLTYFYGITFPILVFIKLIINLLRKW